MVSAAHLRFVMAAVASVHAEQMDAWVTLKLGVRRLKGEPAHAEATVALLPLGSS